MTDGSRAGSPASAGGPAAEGHEEESRFVIRDKRRLDPQTGSLRDDPARPSSQPDQEEATMSNDSGPIASGDDAFAGADGEQQPTSRATGQASANAARAAYEDAAKQAQAQPEPSKPQPKADEEHPDTALAAERLDELKREQARFINYQRRVERDRADDRTRVTAALLESMIPVLDEIYLARQHGDLESGPMAKIAEKLEAVLTKQGVERYGQPGETFDPAVHEAVMHTHAELAPGTTETTVIQVMQPGYKIGDRVVRAALVAVADPQ